MDAVRTLAKILLLEDFGLNVELPEDCLVPRVPQRLNYVLFIDDLIMLNKLKGEISGIDIGLFFAIILFFSLLYHFIEH